MICQVCCTLDFQVDPVTPLTLPTPNTAADTTLPESLYMYCTSQQSPVTSPNSCNALYSATWSPKRSCCQEQVRLACGVKDPILAHTDLAVFTRAVLGHCLLLAASAVHSQWSPRAAVFLIIRSPQAAVFLRIPYYLLRLVYFSPAEEELRRSPQRCAMFQSPRHACTACIMGSSSPHKAHMCTLAAVHVTTRRFLMWNVVHVSPAGGVFPIHGMFGILCGVLKITTTHPGLDSVGRTDTRELPLNGCKTASHSPAPCVQLRGGPDEVCPPHKPPRQQASLITADVPGARPRPPPPPRAPRTAPVRAAVHRGSAKARQVAPVPALQSHSDSSRDCAAGGRCGDASGDGMAAPRLVPMPLDVSDIVVCSLVSLRCGTGAGSWVGVRGEQKHMTSSKHMTRKPRWPVCTHGMLSRDQDIPAQRHVGVHVGVHAWSADAHTCAHRSMGSAGGCDMWLWAFNAWTADASGSWSGFWGYR